uniref:Large ribosomal subunit protein uL29 n=1 Tax=Candidatus Kentrum sp. TC TaxID=2126339 RepID=A0A450YWX6_9GAMM|nr:MAG: large subunit ribosomal protein L29 [Candidatus Kentron sp. TC]VFK48070.1 MAG: large subunit ribosomal protein L29 [Candidatus Kentron sp. TC]VFK61321.1 MAG: large subunit ribosomal protein L29 [Candidatus Kentron sp. TC]
MKAAELREKDDAELRDELVGLNREAFSLRMQVGSGQLLRYSRFKVIRRSIARIKTIINERQRVDML